MEILSELTVAVKIYMKNSKYYLYGLGLMVSVFLITPTLSVQAQVVNDPQLTVEMSAAEEIDSLAVIIANLMHQVMLLQTQLTEMQDQSGVSPQEEVGHDYVKGIQDILDTDPGIYSEGFDW